ncbi:4'-phosphopantetheinyl transferase superfamily protein [Paenibacillus sp. alder61]|uniref:4'-phosphopantetheinyl transferase family protein n=1 Tax=Paenibacillus sp. alder61 TaxID=2862948 RepID=UPI001CD30DE7|nr:4'-phosphopantetheinyl transferase superfamily protein [Paenibacillus sp. alder61]MCA1293870.1 4'-phosphopantetheinyl transferase superfamily protein [Paenibacillus sp. alder61]
MVEIYYIDIEEEISGLDHDALLGICSREKRMEASRFRFEPDRKRAVYGEALARYMIAGKTGLPMNELIFDKNRYGKPYIRGQQRIFFNLSHSGRYVICGLDQEEIGIDLEEVKSMDLGIARKFFHANEYIYLLSREPEQRMDALFELWTLKESYIKYLGVGLQKPLDAFYFNLEAPSVELHSNDRIPAFIQSCTIKGGYKLAVCADSPGPIRVRQMAVKDIVSDIGRRGMLHMQK